MTPVNEIPISLHENNETDMISGWGRGEPKVTSMFIRDGQPPLNAFPFLFTHVKNCIQRNSIGSNPSLSNPTCKPEKGTWVLFLHQYT